MQPIRANMRGFRAWILLRAMARRQRREQAVRCAQLLFGRQQMTENSYGRVCSARRLGSVLNLCSYHLVNRTSRRRPNPLMEATHV